MKNLFNGEMYKYLEHEADMGIVGIGNSLEEAFQEGAKAMFNLMAEIEKVEPKTLVKIFCSAKNVENLFVEFLNELLAKRDLENMLFSKFDVNIIKTMGHFELLGKAYGELLNNEKHGLKTEVKAATYYGLKIEKKDEKYYAQCVLDI